MAAAEDRLSAERSRRRSQLTLAAIAVLILAGAGWRWVETQKVERQAELAANFAGMKTDALQNERSGNYSEAVEIARGGLLLVEAGDANADLLRQAQSLVDSTESSLRAEGERLKKGEKERELFDFLLDMEMRQVSTGFDVKDEDLNLEYAEAFRAYGLDLESSESVEALLEERDTDLGIRLAIGFDGWARLLRRMGAELDHKLRLLTGLGMDLDSNPQRTELRLALVERNSDQILAIAERLDFTSSDPETLALAGVSLYEFGHYKESRALFVRGANQYPSNFLLNFGAGSSLYQLEEGLSTQSYRSAVGYLKVAEALKPDLIGLQVRLGDLYRTLGNPVLAAKKLDLTLKSAPTHRWNEGVLARNFMQVGRFEEALKWVQYEIDGGNPGWFSQSGRFACQVALGTKTFEEYAAWSDELFSIGSYNGEIGIATALTRPGWIGVEPDPERALERLERLLPEGLPEQAYWDRLSKAYFLTEDIPAARAAEKKASELEGGEPSFSYVYYEIHMLLMNAIAARVEGNDQVSEELIVRARWFRDELIAGLEAEWAETEFLKNFEYYESVALGR